MRPGPLTSPSFYDKFSTMGAKKGFVIISLWGCGATSIATLKPFKTTRRSEGPKDPRPGHAAGAGSYLIAGRNGCSDPLFGSPARHAAQNDRRRAQLHRRHASLQVLDGCQAHHADRNGSDHLWLSYAARRGLTSSPQILRKSFWIVAKASTPKPRCQWGHDLTRAAEKNWAGEKGAFVHRLSDADTGRSDQPGKAHCRQNSRRRPENQRDLRFAEERLQPPPVSNNTDTRSDTPGLRSGVFFVLQRCR